MFEWLKNMFTSSNNSESTTHRNPPKNPLENHANSNNIPETPSEKYEYLVNKYVDIPQTTTQFTSRVVINHKDLKYVISVGTWDDYPFGYRGRLSLNEVKVVPRNRILYKGCVNEAMKCQIITAHLEDVIRSLEDINKQIEESDMMTKKKERQLQMCNKRLCKKLQ